MAIKVRVFIVIITFIAVTSFDHNWHEIETDVSLGHYQEQNFNVYDCRTSMLGQSKYLEPFPTCNFETRNASKGTPLSVKFYSPVLEPITVSGQLCKNKIFETTTWENFIGTKSIKEHNERFVPITLNECVNLAKLTPRRYNGYLRI